MNQRERYLAMIVGVSGLLVVGWFVQGWISGAFNARQQKLTSLQSDLSAQNRRVDQGQKAARKIAAYEERSLPANADVARSLYHDWLLEEIGKAGLIEQTVKSGASQTEKNLYTLQEFTITAKGTLPQMVDLLHAFYSVDWLHRMKHFSAKPIKESKLLDIHMTVQALSLQNAANKDLVPRPAQRLALADREAYRKLIVDRNLLGPANNAPKLAISGSKEANTNRSLELSARATDADPLDKVKYRLVESAARDARFDASSGRFSWTPRSTGKYEFTFEAIDDGFPSKSSGPVKVVVNVTDPPPPPPVGPVEPPKLAFDHAKYTVLTAVLDIGGVGEVWLHVRPSGETLKLHAGDKFEIGSIKGTVAQIGKSDFVFDIDGKQRKLEKGGVLDQAQSFTATAASTESEKPVKTETPVSAPDDLLGD